ncbi:MAG: hypothetical protein KA120_08310, partial [Candidatus Goldbacteria bacterium]|nr:hypothetical protein [Candidatus Goldiibacteriota bacterium]
DIVKEKNPDLPKKICMLPPIILDNMIHREYINSVYHLCPAPYFLSFGFIFTYKLNCFNVKNVNAFKHIMPDA